MRARVQITGDAAVLSSLDSLDKKVRRRTIRKATVAGGKEVLKTAKAEAQTFRVTGFFARSLKQITSSRKGTVTTRIGQAKQRRFKARKSTRARGKNLSNIQRAGNPVPIHWVERGTRPHTITAKNGGVLAWRTGRKTKKRSGLSFARKVKSPGMRGRGLIAKTVARSRRRAARRFYDTIKKDLNSVN